GPEVVAEYVERLASGDRAEGATRTSARSDSVATRFFAIGSQGRGACGAGPAPHPPFNPYVRFSRIRLTDGLLGMVTRPSGSGWFRRAGADPGRGTRTASSGSPG